MSVVFFNTYVYYTFIYHYNANNVKKWKLQKFRLYLAHMINNSGEYKNTWHN